MLVYIVNKASYQLWQLKELMFVKSLEQHWALLAIVFIIIVIIIEAMGFLLLNSDSLYEETLLRVT